MWVLGWKLVWLWERWTLVMLLLSFNWSWCIVLFIYSCCSQNLRVFFFIPTSRNFHVIYFQSCLTIILLSEPSMVSTSPRNESCHIWMNVCGQWIFRVEILWFIQKLIKISISYSSANRTMYILCLSPIGQNDKIMTTLVQHYTTMTTINNYNHKGKNRKAGSSVLFVAFNQKTSDL